MSDVAATVETADPAASAAATGGLSIASVLEGGLPADEAAAGEAAASAAAPSFLDGFTDAETKAYMERKGFKTLDDVGKAYTSLERRFSNDANRIVLPESDTDQEGFDRVAKALGRPDTPDGYGFAELQGVDPAFSKEAAGWLHEAGVGKGRAAALAEKWNAYVSGRETAAQAEFEAQSNADWAGLQTEFGPKFAENVEMFRRGAQTFGLGKEQMGAIERALGTQATVKLFAKIGQGLGEDKFVEGQGKQQFGMSKEQAEARIDTLRRDQQWQARWMAGGADEKAEWSRLTKIAAQT